MKHKVWLQAGLRIKFKRECNLSIGKIGLTISLTFVRKEL